MIDYGVLSEASAYYASAGFARVDAPWLVSHEISGVTRPPEADDYVVKKSSETKTKSFVASGEQSLLYLINKGHLPSTGMFHTITPCMRNESFDETHTKYFMKCELIRYWPVGQLTDIENYILSTMRCARSFFISGSGFQIEDEHMRIEKTSDVSFDIVLDCGRYGEIELGSYGYRECGFCEWIYGTGVAEPRFSNSLRLYRRVHGGLPLEGDT